VRLGNAMSRKHRPWRPVFLFARRYIRHGTSGPQLHEEPNDQTSDIAWRGIMRRKRLGIDSSGDRVKKVFRKRFRLSVGRAAFVRSLTILDSHFTLRSLDLTVVICPRLNVDLGGGGCRDGNHIPRSGQLRSLQVDRLRSCDVRQPGLATTSRQWWLAQSVHNPMRGGPRTFWGAAMSSAPLRAISGLHWIRMGSEEPILMLASARRVICR
jgi:hypothetical protein